MQFITNNVPAGTDQKTEAFAADFVELLKKHGIDPAHANLSFDGKNVAVNTSRSKAPAKGWADDLAPDDLPSKGAPVEDTRRTAPTDPDKFNPADLAPEA
ncbi:hypothetical protein [Halomonas salipaludis]|uniref:Uncharacterized protein n=1 Tax=Halomonas salipaludis TaxID=2032625 RepID=A0A2A2F2D3_9GAMM|nr:hypothetical protein [Halomonas salipaludis]PAU78930.1 hypothetical protein CK498_00670 [Halomonas salipaludis]